MYKRNLRENYIEELPDSIKSLKEKVDYKNKRQIDEEY